MVTTYCLLCGSQYSLDIRPPGSRCNDFTIPDKQFGVDLWRPGCPGKVVTSTVILAVAYELGLVRRPDGSLPPILDSAVCLPHAVVVTLEPATFPAPDLIVEEYRSQGVPVEQAREAAEETKRRFGEWLAEYLTKQAEEAAQEQKKPPVTQEQEEAKS